MDYFQIQTSLLYTENPNNHICLPLLSLPFIYKVLQFSKLTETLQRGYRSTPWLGLSCTVIGCMCSQPENKAYVYIKLTFAFHSSFSITWWCVVREGNALPVMLNWSQSTAAPPMPPDFLSSPSAWAQLVPSWYTLTYLWECFTTSLHTHPTLHLR